MEKSSSGKVNPVQKNEKKKQIKNGQDRLKQAEKKKRRIEKALATSAAICAELEKKKQKKIEEQKRLDEEGAAIAESVALLVLEEDTEESYYSNLKNDNHYNCWNYSNNSDLPIDHGSFVKYSAEGLAWARDTCDPVRWNNWELGSSLMPHLPVKELHVPIYDVTVKCADISVELMAAQAVSSLKIVEDSRSTQLVGPGGATASH